MLEAILREVSPGDWTLERFLLLADIGIGTSISLLVDGVWIQGDLVQREVWADQLDQQLDEGFGKAVEAKEKELGTITDPASLEPGTKTPGDIERYREAVTRQTFRDLVDETREGEQKLADEVDALDADAEMSDELADRAFRDGDPIRTITLRNAVVEGPTPIRDRHIEVVRVLRSKVGAWHLGRNQEFESQGDPNPLA